MKKYGEVVSESYLLRRTYMAISEKHSKLDDALAELRRVAGVSGVPTTYAKAYDYLVDTFDFEIPDSAKTMTAVPKVPANFGGTQPPAKRKIGNDKPRVDQDDDKPKRKRKSFPKGSCVNCPESTSHTTPYCYKTRRKKMGLPNGWKWCTKHRFGTHYDHMCRRHAPNYPSAPKIISAVAHASPTDSTDLVGRLSELIASQNQTSVMPAAQQQRGIHVTPAKSADFPKARDTSANVANDGPSVNNIMQTILNMNKLDRQLLTNRLAKAGI